MKYTEETALKKISKEVRIVEKKIILDGSCGLATLGAIDFLCNQCNYIAVISDERGSKDE